MKQENIPEYRIFRSNIKNIYITIKEGEIIVKAPRLFPEKEIDNIVLRKKDWIEKARKRSEEKEKKKERYTKEEFTQVVEKNVKELISQTNLRPNHVRIREIYYAWGSCSSGKNITISAKLICYSEQAIRYVILHELCHLKYMNHSKDFWDLVENYMPNYKQVKKEFK